LVENQKPTVSKFVPGLEKTARPKAGGASTILCRHFAAGVGAGFTGRDAFIHVADSLAVLGALGANLGAFPAGMLVMRGVDQHEMRRSSAHFRAGHHQPEVSGFSMLSAGFKAMIHRRRQAGLIAAQTDLDAAGHFFVHVVHRISKKLSEFRRRVSYGWGRLSSQTRNANWIYPRAASKPPSPVYFVQVQTLLMVPNKRPGPKGSDRKKFKVFTFRNLAPQNRI
jgi:hypothetical protein